MSESTALAGEEGQGSSSQSTPVVGTKRRRGRGGKLHRVWSPSGGELATGQRPLLVCQAGSCDTSDGPIPLPCVSEVAQEGSGEDMEGEEGEEEGKDLLQTSSLGEDPLAIAKSNAAIC